MKKSIVRNSILTVLFVVMLYSLVRYLGFVCFPKINEKVFECQDYASYYFSLADRDSIDTVFIGNSHQHCSVDVNILNKEYSMSSILLTSSAQSLTLSYYAVMEAIELQHPDTIVLETFYARKDTEEVSDYGMHVFYDPMPNFSTAKFYGIKESGDPWYYYYLPFTALHDTWYNLTASDFVLPGKLPEGEQYRYYYEHTTPIDRIVSISPDKKEPLAKAVEDNLNRIVSLCDSNNIELILYTAPYVASESDQAKFNSLSDYAAQHGLRYYNLFHELDDIGLDYESDFLDVEHFNHFGQEKFTRYCAEKGYFESQRRIS